MTEEHPRPDISDIPEAVAEPKRRWSIQLVWLVPIIAALIGGTFAVRAILERGPTITITFKTGAGLEAGKTRIKYKEVEIGEVKNVAISEDRSQVIVTARLGRESKGLLVEDTRFWVVRPRIYGGNISGLGTLLGGTYIGVDVGKSTKPSRTFDGLEAPPAVTKDVPGTAFFLHAADLGSLNITSPIFFRRLQVGQVVAYELDRVGRGVTFTIFINSPYDRFVKANTLFWHASGIDLSLTAGGLKVNTESIVAILSGGVAFQTPEGQGRSASGGPEFRLLPVCQQGRCDEARRDLSNLPAGVQRVGTRLVREFAGGVPWRSSRRCHQTQPAVRSPQEGFLHHGRNPALS